MLVSQGWEIFNREIFKKRNVLEFLTNRLNLKIYFPQVLLEYTLPQDLVVPDMVYNSSVSTIPPFKSIIDPRKKQFL
jgi:hypothetical protein